MTESALRSRQRFTVCGHCMPARIEIKTVFVGRPVECVACGRVVTELDDEIEQVDERQWARAIGEERRALYDNLTATQQQCNNLLLELRNVRRGATTTIPMKPFTFGGKIKYEVATGRITKYTPFEHDTTAPALDGADIVLADPVGEPVSSIMFVDEDGGSGGG